MKTGRLNIREQLKLSTVYIFTVVRANDFAAIRIILSGGNSFCAIMFLETFSPPRFKFHIDPRYYSCESYSIE